MRTCHHGIVVYTHNPKLGCQLGKKRTRSFMLRWHKLMMINLKFTSLQRMTKKCLYFSWTNHLLVYFSSRCLFLGFAVNLHYCCQLLCLSESAHLPTYSLPKVIVPAPLMQADCSSFVTEGCKHIRCLRGIRPLGSLFCIFQLCNSRINVNTSFYSKVVQS
jgi:hypothetical protein